MRLRVLAAYAVFEAILSLLLLSSCRDGLEDGPPILQFAVGELALTEGDSLNVTLAISGNSQQDDTVAVDIEQSFLSITAIPAIANNRIRIPVYKGRAVATFRIVAVENNRLEGDRTVVLRLTNPGSRFRVGALSSLNIQVRDDEAPSVAEFAMTEATLQEGKSDGIVVPIPLSVPIKGEGTGEIRISILSTNAAYGVDFTTVPAAVNGIISLALGPDDAGTSFVVSAIDNELLDGSRAITFRLQGAFGSITKGKLTDFVVTLIDNEVPSWIGFPTDLLTVGGTDPGYAVDIVLDRPAEGRGTFSIGFDEPYGLEGAVYGKDFLTEPAPGANGMLSFQVELGDSKFSFKIVPIDNVRCSSRVIIAYVTAANGVLRVGGGGLSPIVSVVLKDNESPEAQFAVVSGSILENDAAGLKVQILLSKATPALDEVIITVPPGFGTRYFTNLYLTKDPFYYPDWDKIAVSFPINSTSSQFLIYPINNMEKAGFQGDFTLEVKSYGCILVSTSQKFRLTILDDD